MSQNILVALSVNANAYTKGKAKKYYYLNSRSYTSDSKGILRVLDNTDTRRSAKLALEDGINLCKFYQRQGYRVFTTDSALGGRKINIC
jgi:hypothetical protein